MCIDSPRQDGAPREPLHAYQCGTVQISAESQDYSMANDLVSNTLPLILPSWCASYRRAAVHPDGRTVGFFYLSAHGAAG